MRRPLTNGGGRLDERCESVLQAGHQVAGRTTYFISMLFCAGPYRINMAVE